MRKFLLGGVALMVMAGAADAADLPVKAPVYKAPIAVAYDWTGFYLGGYVGTSIGQSRAETTGFTGVVDVSKGSWAAGGVAGANYQFNRNWLIGIEADLGYFANDRSFTEFNDPAITVGVKTSWLGTVRGRFGYVTGPSLLYVTGGAAFLRMEDKFGGCTTTFCVPSATAATSSTTHTGWTVGGGIETKLSQNWSTTSEYLYIDGGSTSFTANPFGVFSGPQTASFQHQFHLIKTGLNYKFGGPSEPLPFFSGTLLPTDHNWAGFYIGGNLGGGLTTTRVPGNSFAPGFPIQGENDLRGNGFTGGVQAGYNVMNLLGRANWFAGVEGDIGYLGIRASRNDWFDSGYLTSQKTDWYGTVRGRLGTTTGPALLYGTAGAAFVSVRNEFTFDPTLAGAGVIITPDASTKVRTGWTIGGGTEVALDARWSAKLEYLYIDAGRETRSFSGSGAGGPATISSDFKNQFHVIRAGVNYNFNAPLVAKY